MPIYMNIDRMERSVTMVAHGLVSDGEIVDIVRELIEADVPDFGKIIDTSAAVSNLTDQQIATVAEVLRTAHGQRRGPVAYVIDPDRSGFAHRFAVASEKDRPIRLFTSLREARAWIREFMADPAQRP